MFYILNLCEIIYWLIRVVSFNYSPHTYHMLYIKNICQTICVYEALMPFPHGRFWIYPDLPKQSRYYFCFSSSVFRAPGVSCWHMCPLLRFATVLPSLPYADMNPSFFYQKCFLVIWFTEYSCQSLLMDLSL